MERKLKNNSTARAERERRRLLQWRKGVDVSRFPWTAEELRARASGMNELRETLKQEGKDADEIHRIVSSIRDLERHNSDFPFTDDVGPSRTEIDDQSRPIQEGTVEAERVPAPEFTVRPRSSAARRPEPITQPAIAARKMRKELRVVGDIEQAPLSETDVLIEQIHHLCHQGRYSDALHGVHTISDKKIQERERNKLFQAWATLGDYRRALDRAEQPEDYDACITGLISSGQLDTAKQLIGELAQRVRLNTEVLLYLIDEKEKDDAARTEGSALVDFYARGS